MEAWSRRSIEARERKPASVRSSSTSAEGGGLGAVLTSASTGDILFLYMGSAPIRVGEIVVFNIAGRRALALRRSEGGAVGR